MKYNLMYFEHAKLWNPSIIWKELIRRGLTLQVVTKVATQRDEKEREQYRFVIKHLVDPNFLEQVVFMDETGRSKNAARRRRHWSKKGVTPLVKAAYLGEHDPTYTMIAACDVNGFIKEACDVVLRKKGKNDKDPTRGTVDGDRFALWVEECLVPILGNYQRREPRSIVILDNASIHHSDRIRDLILDACAHIIYLSPYSPDYNPIELMFNMYKMSVKRHAREHDWLVAHNIALCCVKPHQARNLYRKCLLGEKDEEEDKKKNLKRKAAVIACLQQSDNLLSTITATVATYKKERLN